MLLQKLREYSSRPDFEMPPTLYAEAPVRYIIGLDENGRLLTREPIDTADPSSPRSRRGTRRLIPFIVRTSATQPLLYADSGEYTFGILTEGKEKRGQQRHDAYLELIQQCADDTELESAIAVAAFLKSEPLEALTLSDDFDAGASITFQVNGRFIVDEPAIRRFWAKRFDPAQDAGSEAVQCFVCGEHKLQLARTSGLIKGVPGGQPSGTTLVFPAGNESSFNSYGIASKACAQCEEDFTQALNRLLSGERSSIRVGGTAFAFWTREHVEWDFYSLLERAEPEQVYALFTSLRSGRRGPDLDANRFYAIALSAAGGRAVVREWIDIAVSEAQESLERWFRRQAIVDAASGELRYFSLRALAGATVRDLRDISPPTSRSLLRAALGGTALPLDMMFAAVRRTRAEQRVTAPQAALIKLVLASLPGRTQEEEMVELQPDHPSGGYQCGRLLAVLESVQRAALPGIKAGIVDRFYGSASSSPGGVFPRLVRGAQPHLGKLERDRKAAHVALQQRLEEVLGHLPAFPKVLSLEEQGLFALGYYHQRAADRARIREAMERRRAGAASIEDEREAALADAQAEDESS